MTRKFNQYLGKAGHFAVMSEFLMLGWNVAKPEVDVGDDIFVVQDNNGTLRRVQVKTAGSTIHQLTFSEQFQVPIKQLKSITTIPVHYVFIVRYDNIWTQPVIIRQDYLLDHFENNKLLVLNMKGV
ncbi:MAG: hypothetical protein WKG06_39940 [Segetibacter sp.]